MTGGAGLRAGPPFWGIVVALLLLGTVVRGVALPASPPLADDRLAGASAVNFVERGQIGPTMWHHPRLRDMAVYASIRALGTGKVGLTLPSFLLGILCIPAVALLGRRVGGARVGIVAAALLALDPLHVGYSRQAVQEVYVAALAVAGVLLALEYDRTARVRLLVGAGVAFGAGAAAKWSVAFAAAAAFAWLVALGIRRASDRRDAASRVALLVATLVLLPLAVYAATWLPWLLGGHGLADLVRLHGAMAREMATHGGYAAADLAYSHRAAAWFLRPAEFASVAITPDGPVPYVFISNPVVWLLVLPSAAIVARSAWRRRSAPEALLVATFAATYAPFLLASRPIWLHSALAVLPFATLLVALAAVRFADRLPRPAAALAVYVAIVAAVSIPLDLLATGGARSSPALRGLAERYRPPLEAEEAARRPAGAAQAPGPGAVPVAGPRP